MSRFEARVRDEPGQLWGVWDNGAEVWRETMLGTSEEDDARQSAEVMNSLPGGYTLRVRVRVKRSPTTFLARLIVAVAFSSAAMQLTVPDNWHPAGPAVGFIVAAIGLGWAWWKLLQAERFKPDVHVQTELAPCNEDDEKGKDQC